MIEYSVSSLPLFASSAPTVPVTRLTKTDPSRYKVRKPAECQQCGCKQMREIDGRWVCRRCGEVQMRRA